METLGKTLETVLRDSEAKDRKIEELELELAI